MKFKFNPWWSLSYQLVGTELAFKTPFEMSAGFVTNECDQSLEFEAEAENSLKTRIHGQRLELLGKESEIEKMS